MANSLQDREVTTTPKDPNRAITLTLRYYRVGDDMPIEHACRCIEQTVPVDFGSPISCTLGG